MSFSPVFAVLQRADRKPDLSREKAKMMCFVFRIYFVMSSGCEHGFV